jgi:hypothetical protein
MSLTITIAQQKAIADYVNTHQLPVGLGKAESACSIAAINLALTGELTDSIPPCMSLVVGEWIIKIQDVIPAEMRNSAEWKQLLPFAAGTGYEHERERIALIMNWMWEVVLPTLQPIADEYGYGDKWKTMCERKDYISAYAAAAASDSSAADAARYAADASSASAAARFAAAVAASAVADAADNIWQSFNPCGLLRKLIEVSVEIPDFVNAY